MAYGLAVSHLAKISRAAWRASQGIGARAQTRIREFQTLCEGFYHATVQRRLTSASGSIWVLDNWVKPIGGSLTRAHSRSRWPRRRKWRRHSAIEGHYDLWRLGTHRFAHCEWAQATKIISTLACLISEPSSSRASTSGWSFWDLEPAVPWVT